MSYDIGGVTESRLIRLQCELERQHHETRMSIDRRLHELEMEVIRSSRFDPAPYMVIVTTAIVVGLVLSK